MRVKLKNPNTFKEMVIKAGYTQRSFGRALGISEPYANQIANGVRNPSPVIAKKICDILGVKFDEIFFIETACNSKISTPQSKAG